DVLVWKKPEDLPVRLHQAGVLPLRPGNLLRIEVELNRPAYLYLVYIDSSGKATPLYPWETDDWQKRPAQEAPRDRLRIPDSGKGAPLEPGLAGIESILLLARDEALPPGRDAEIVGQFAGLPGQSRLVPLLTAAWFRDGELVRDEQDRGPLRQGRAEEVND